MKIRERLIFQGESRFREEQLHILLTKMSHTIDVYSKNDTKPQEYIIEIITQMKVTIKIN